MNRRMFLGAAAAARAQDNHASQTIARELRRTKPDYIVFVPKHWDGSTNDGHNEHFLVFDGPDGSFMAVWTQSPGLKGRGQKNRIMFSTSKDDGVTWQLPTRVAGPRDFDDPAPMASWGFPMVSRSERIYVLWTQNDGSKGWIQMHTGRMAGCHSDDHGRTWSDPQMIALPRSPYDDPTGKTPGEWIVWQKPMRDLHGNYFVGYTHWVNEAASRVKKVENWTQIESVCEFMRFENVDKDPQPRDLRLRFSAWGDKALRVPYYRDPLASVAQEPSIVRLPDKSLFCVMRTNTGYIWYTVSRDDGENWCSPRPLLRRDFGRPILQSVSSCPIYQLSDGRYVLFHHNRTGDLDAHPEATHLPRYPCCVALGEFRPGADQPIWFSESKVLMDTEGMGVDGSKEGPGNRVQTAIGVYPSFTTRKGNNVLWHPDRKFFLLGKRITNEFLAGLDVPKRRS